MYQSLPVITNLFDPAAKPPTIECMRDTVWRYVLWRFSLVYYHHSVDSTCMYKWYPWSFAKTDMYNIIPHHPVFYINPQVANMHTIALTPSHNCSSHWCWPPSVPHCCSMPGPEPELHGFARMVGNGAGALSKGVGRKEMKANRAWPILHASRLAISNPKKGPKHWLNIAMGSPSYGAQEVP